MNAKSDRPPRRPLSRRRKWLFRLITVFVPLAIAFAILEVVISAQLPSSGLTPVMSPKLKGIPYELRPEFETLYHGHTVRINSDGYRGGEAAPASNARTADRDDRGFGDVRPRRRGAYARGASLVGAACCQSSGSSDRLAALRLYGSNLLPAGL